jgi:hypothetical protein
MKTFLWTTLFWIIVAIAGLLCLGFGNLGTQVLDNEWVASIMPKNLQSKVCDYDAVVESALQSIDWCAAAEANNCTPAVVESEETENVSEDTAWMQEPLSSIIANQEIIYNYIQESVASINQSIADLQNNVYVAPAEEEEVIDEKEQMRLQLQAQIEALQNEMASL